MDLYVWLSFVLFATIAVLTPGPAVLLAVTFGGTHGAGGAVFPVLGNVTGLAVIVTATAVGVGSVVEASSHWLVGLRVVGGLYLAYLGARLLLTKAAALNVDPTIAPRKTYCARHSYMKGVGVALSNPKALLFVGALFPQFIDAAHPVWPQFAIMGLTMMLLSFSGLMMYAALSGKLMARGRHALSTRINKISGALFILFGFSLVAGSR